MPSSFLKIEYCLRKRTMREQTLPLVSVIMPVHNAGRFLVPAIEHIVKQTYPRIELIIAAYGITNETWQRLKKIKSGAPKRIRLFRLREVSNALTAINAVIPRARGSYIAIADESSLWSKTKIEKQLRSFTTFPAPVAVATFAKVVLTGHHPVQYKYSPSDPDALSRFFALINPLETSTLIVRRDALPNPEILFRTMHGEAHVDATMLNLFTRGRIVVIPEFLVTRMQKSKQSLIEMKKMFTSNIQARLDAVKHTGLAVPAWALAFLITQYVILQTVPDAWIAGLEALNSSIRKLQRTLSKRMAKTMHRKMRYAFPFS